MSDLREQLERLAEEAPRRLPASDLWARGRRQHRTRQAGTAALLVALVVVLGLVLGLGRLSQRQPEPTAPRGSTTIPNRIYSPSGWLPSTDQKGPLGQLIALIPTTRHHLFGSTDGYVGVSPGGEYRFIDLPRSADPSEIKEGSEATLSPDGRRIAYWTTGVVHRPDGNRTLAVTGIAVYDASTGRVVDRARFATRRGLVPDETLWTTNDSLVLDAGQTINAQESNDYVSYLWSLGRTPRRFDHTLSDTGDITTAPGGRYVVDITTNDDENATLVPVSGARAPRRVHITEAVQYPPVVSVGLRRVAGVWVGPDPEHEYNPNRLVVGQRRAHELYFAHVVPGRRVVGQVLAWQGQHHVLVVRLRRGLTHLRAAVASIDTRTGSDRTLIDMSSVGAVQVATDLVTHRTVSTPAPPHPWNPREEYGWLTAWVLACLAGLVVWRRRARP